MQNIATTANVELLADVASDCTDGLQRAVFVEATCTLDSYVDTGRVLEFHERLLFNAIIEHARHLRAIQQHEQQAQSEADRIADCPDCKGSGLTTAMTNAPEPVQHVVECLHEKLR